MCMSTVSFATTYRNGEYVGVGYKVIENYDLDDSPIKNDKIQWKVIREHYHKDWSNVWTKANTPAKLRIHSDEDSTNKIKGAYGEYFEKKDYPRGFHIFLTQEDAQAYDTDGTVVKVEFKEILAFGNNLAGHYNRPCVITNWMRIVGICKKVEKE